MKLLRFSTRALSALVGAFAQIPLPVFLRRALFLLYSRFYSVRLEDCVSPPEAYPSLLSFFLRDVRDRKIEDGVVSPADGLITEAGEIVSGRLFQAKGRSYTLSELLADGSLAAEFEGGWYLTIYLAPGDYHHVHAPISGSIREVRSISGLSLPVNGWSVRMFERVFPRNERVVLRIADSSGREYLLVMVGALNVGSLRLSYPGLLPEVSLEELFYSRGV